MAGRGRGTSPRPAGAPSADASPDGRRGRGGGEGRRGRAAGTNLASAASLAASPIARENVISPSKMKQRSREAGAAERGSKQPTTRRGRASVPRVRPHVPDSRDDREGLRRPAAAAAAPSTPSSVATTPRASSSSRRPDVEGAGPASPSSRRAPASPSRATQHAASPRGAKRGAAAAAETQATRREREHAAPREEEAVVSSATAAAQMPEEDERRARLQKKLLSNLRLPDPTLLDLLTVLTDFAQTSHLRRVNACGAVKTLTLHKANQIPLARTKGVVPALTSVLCAVNATEEERTRCINALMHLCVPPENWKLVYLFPQTPEALARNMADKYPQIRYAACLATSFLAKKNRRDVIRNRLLMYAMARVLEVDRNGALGRMGAQDRKVFVGARLCVLKMLLHLSKNRDVSVALARTECSVNSLVAAANTMELAANILCIAILTNLTRHPDNAFHLVHGVPRLVRTFVLHVERATGGPFDDHAEGARCALYALQNLSCANDCRQELANGPDLLGCVTKAAFRHDCPDQQLSALHTLKNLSDDPFNLVTMTNTPGCTATLLALANNDASCAAGGGGEAGRSTAKTRDNTMAQYLACDTLATLSHWLLTLSATRLSKGGNGSSGGVDITRRTFNQCTYEAWT